MSGGITALARETFDSVEECIASKPIEVDVMSWSCQSIDGSTWTATGSGASMVSDPMEVGFLVVLFILWSLVPLCIAAWLAMDRDESIAIAVVLTLFLGWIGLAIVYFGQQRSRTAVEGLADRAVSPPPTPPASGGPAPPPVEERLTRLDRMHADGLLSDQEHQEQRRRILDSL